MTLRGAAAKAKANASQGIPELIQIANNNEYSENRKESHAADGKKYLYDFLKIKKEMSSPLES